MNKKYIIIVISVLVFSCRMPSNPEGIEIVKHIGPLNTYGECLDLDVNDSIIVAAANFNGFMIYDIYDSLGKFNPRQKYHGSDFDPSAGDNQINKVRISESPPSIVLMDKYDRISVNRIDGAPFFYIGGGINDQSCYGAVWTDFALDENIDMLRIFTVVDNNMATEFIGELDTYSKSIIWQEFNNFTQFPEIDEISSMNGCEYSVNLFDEANHIHFSNDSLLTIGLGELGVRVFKQISEDRCYEEISSESADNAFYIDISPDGVVSGWPWSDRSIKANTETDSARVLVVLEMGAMPQIITDIKFYNSEDSLIDMEYSNDNTLKEDNKLWIEKNNELFYVYFMTQADIARFQFTISDNIDLSLPKNPYVIISEFVSTNNSDNDKAICENGILLNGFNGIYEPKGGLDLNPLIEFDVLGEVNSVYSQNHLILTGLSNSNGLLLTQINPDGDILFQKSLAKGYSVNDVYATDTLIGLAVGHGGVLIYSIEGHLEGRLASNYANAVKIKDKNIYVATEDGIEIFVID